MQRAAGGGASGGRGRWCCGSRGQQRASCSVAGWSFGLNVAAVLLLAVAAACPWYATSSRHVLPRASGGTVVVTTDRFLLWWWSGVYVHTTSTSNPAPSPKPSASASPLPSPSSNATAAAMLAASANGASATVMTLHEAARAHTLTMMSGWPSVREALGEGREGESTSWELIPWSDRRYNLSAAKSIYHSANAMALLGLGFGLLLGVCLFYAVASCYGPRATFHRQFTHCKSLITCFSCLTLLFSCLAWGLFLYFPTALGNHCVPKFTCDMFFGAASQTYNTPQESVSVVWSPFVGWAVALLATPLTLLVFVVSCFVKKPPASARPYRLVIN